jgi:YrbI family 3-deoxy-D-manno-octulosonate 8-phosphate phosphatase
MLEEQASQIKLLFLDVDGVLTDGSVTLDSRGEETKTFHIKDGLGIKMLLKAGIEVVLVTGRSSNALAQRAGELGIHLLHQGVAEKGTLCRKIISEMEVHRAQVCCVGDDLPDLAVFALSGLRIAVADAAPEVREAAHVITRNRGGKGAVREVSEWLLKSQGKWAAMVDSLRGE